MTVLFLSQIVPYPPHGGVLQRGYHVIRELSSRARIHLLAFVHPDVLASQAAQEESRRQLRRFCDTVEYFRLWPKTSAAHRLAAIGSSLCSSQPFSVIAHRSRAFQHVIDDRIGRGGVDVIHVDTIALAPFVAGVRAAGLVLTHHNIESVLMERRAAFEGGAVAKAFLRREAAKLRAYERSTSPTFDMNIVMSAKDESVLVDLAPGVRTAVVPNGVDIDYFAPDSHHEEPALIYAGGMNMFANRDAVLHFCREVWPLIVRRRPALRFVVVGQDPPLELKAIAREDSRIEVTGFVEDIRPFIRRAAVYVVPLRVGGGTRLKVLDAMASGKALVSTSIGCEGLEIQAGEHVLIADSPMAFADATLALLDSPTQRRRLGAAARALVEHRYSWHAVGDCLLQAYGRARSEWERHG